MRILHVLDHSLPLHSGYAFRTLAILREQRALGWETVQLTTPRHGPVQPRTTPAAGVSIARPLPPAFGAFPAREVRAMTATTRRIHDLTNDSNRHPARAFAGAERFPALWVGRHDGFRSSTRSGPFGKMRPSTTA